MKQIYKGKGKNYFAFYYLDQTVLNRFTFISSNVKDFNSQIKAFLSARSFHLYAKHTKSYDTGVTFMLRTGLFQDWEVKRYS